LQDPFVHLLQKDISQKELLKLYHTDDRFRGMLELYSLFRDVISLERLSEDKEQRLGNLSQTLETIEVQLSEALDT
jgi:hypothetical protein